MLFEADHGSLPYFFQNACPGSGAGVGGDGLGAGVGDGLGAGVGMGVGPVPSTLQVQGSLA